MHTVRLKCHIDYNSPPSGDETFFADILAGIAFNSHFTSGKLALPLILEFFLLRFCPDRSA